MKPAKLGLAGSNRTWFPAGVDASYGVIEMIPEDSNPYSAPNAIGDAQRTESENAKVSRIALLYDNLNLFVLILIVAWVALRLLA